MRKALTVSAIAVAASMALAVPATAFAADTGPTPSPTSSTAPDAPAPDTAAATLSLGRTTAAPGDQVDVTVTAPAGSTEVAVSSQALDGVTLSDNGDGTWTGTATVAQADDGDYGVALTGTGPDGTALQASADLTVRNDTPAPAPQASLSLSKDNGAPGAKVDVVIEPGDLEGAAHVTSDAFGGRVNLTEQADGSWKGTATVKAIERSYYGVTGYVGSTEVDTVKFTVTENNNKPKPKPKPSPVVGKSVILLGKSSGKAGDKVAVTLDAPSIGPHNKLDVRSAAFGGRVHLTQGKDGKWHGTATVAKVRNGSYDVTSPIARTVHFKVIGSGSKPHGHGGVQPLAPGDHKTPKGSVDTGMAPAAASATTSHAGAAGLLLGTGVLGAASLAGAFGLRRRKNND